MPYVPTDWVDGVTPVDASRLDKIEAGIVAAEEKSLKAQANGYASLDSGGKVPLAQLPPVGADLVYNGSYVPATPYEDGDVVVYNGIAYMAVKPTTAAPVAWPGGSTPEIPHTGGELAYAENTTNTTVSATSEATANTVITAPALTFDGSTPVVIEFYSPYVASPSAGVILLTLFDGSVPIGHLAQTAINGSAVPMTVRRRLTPTAGAHTYSVRAWFSGSGTGSVYGGAGGAAGTYSPAYIRISLSGPRVLEAPGHLVPVSYSTSLPASPVDGQEAILVDSVANPTYTWRFRFNAQSSSAYKWEFVGGPPASSYLQPSGFMVANWNASEPSLVVPRSGEYFCDGSGLFVMDVSKLIGLSVWTTAVLGMCSSHATPAGAYWGLRTNYTKVSLTGGTTIYMALYAASTGTSVQERTLTMLPVRVA